MKKEVIIVPQDKCPMDVLAELGERTKNSWIYLHENAVKNLKNTASFIEVTSGYFEKIVWTATESNPATTIIFSSWGIWHQVIQIIASDIAFEDSAQDPEEIYFLKMAE